MRSLKRTPWALAGAFLLALPAAATEAPMLDIETVATPVHAARLWTEAVAPNPRGGFNYIAQYYNYVYGHEGLEKLPEWVVVDLQTGQQRSFHLPGYANTNYTRDQVLRAGNGRIFFAAMGNRIYYYEPATEEIKLLAQVAAPDSGYQFCYRLIIGPDGKLYGTTQASHGRVGLLVVDPDTLAYRFLPDLAGLQRNEGLTYGYYLAVDPPWAYVAVGKGEWSLIAVNLETDEQQTLAAERQWMSFNITATGVRASIKSVAPTPQSVAKANSLYTWLSKNEYWWCYGGKLVPANVDGTVDVLPGPSLAQRHPTPTAPALQLPEVATSPPDQRGNIALRWRPGAEAEWQTRTIAIDSVAGVLLGGLQALPDGSLLGNAKQYQGFYRYWPGEDRLESFGPHGPSGPVFALLNSLVYFSGYPNAQTFVYDPARPWQTATSKDVPAEATANPRALTYLGSAISGAHFAYFLIPTDSGRLYFGGRLERGHTGSSVAWYDPASGAAAGHHRDLNFLRPRGMLVFEKLGKVVLSGELQTDPNAAGPPPETAELVVFDLDLIERQRLTVKPKLPSTGWLYAISETEFIGCIAHEQLTALYRYDLAAGNLTQWQDLTAPVALVSQRLADGSWWVLQADELVSRLDPQTLALTPAGKLARPVRDWQWLGRRLYGTDDADLVRATRDW